MTSCFSQRDNNLQRTRERCKGELSLNDFGNDGTSLRDGIARAARMPSKSSSERSNLIALECPMKSTMGGNLIGRTLNKCESNRKKAMELGGRRTHSTSAFKPSSVSRTTRDETFCFPIYGRNSKEAVRAPLPATSGVHRAKQAIRKGGSSKGEPKASSASAGAPFRSMLAFRSELMPTWRLIRLAPSSARRSP